MIKEFGWIQDTECGYTGNNYRRKYTDLRLVYEQLLKDAVIAYPIENFGRLNHDSKFIILAIALALYGAKLAYAKDKKQNIGILGTNSNGALDANLAYFQDYVDNGKILGRGNLLIYTLPSSPLAEAAIHFGLTGKLLYLGFAKNTEQESLKYALNILKNESTNTLLLVNANSQKAVCHVLRKTK
jgi:hypothetical protein